MHEIKRVIRAAAWRLALKSMVTNVVFGVAGALSGAVVLRLVQQLWPLSEPLPWAQIAYWGGGAVLVGAAAWTLFRRDSQKTVARRVDEGADLRESLSTALFVAGSDDPWSRATVETATVQARGVNLRQALPIQPPRFWPVPLALALSLLVVWIAIGQRQTSALIAKAEEKARMIEVTTSADEVKKIEEKLAELMPESAPDTADPGVQAPQDAKTPEEMSLQAIKKLTAVMDRLDQLKESENGKLDQEMSDRLKQLKAPGPGPLTEMSKDLAKGDFAKAAEKLAEQLKKAQAGELSEKEKQAMAEQLAKLAEQMNKLAEDRQNAEQMLEKAGLNKELAKDPAKLAEALKQAQNLSEEQKKQIADACKAADKASAACKSMGSCMSQMASSMSQSGQMSPDAMNAMQELAQQMGDLQKLASQMSGAQDAMSECKAQMDALAKLCKAGQAGMGECNNPGGGEGDPKAGKFKDGWSTSQGNGSGGPGRGRGSRRDEQKAAFTTKIEKQKVDTQAGPVIASEVIDSDGLQRGESTQAVSDAVAAAEQNASEAMEGNDIPREFHDAVKHYFGRLKAKTKAGSEKPAPPAPAAAPAAAAPPPPGGGE